MSVAVHACDEYTLMDLNYLTSITDKALFLHLTGRDRCVVVDACRTILFKEKSRGALPLTETAADLSQQLHATATQCVS